MGLDLNDCAFFGPALSEPFAKFELEGYLKKSGLLPSATGDSGKALREFWEAYRRRLRNLGDQGGPLRVLHHVVEPLAEPLGYRPEPAREEEIKTREGFEDGGWLLSAREGAGSLRVWALQVGTDLDAPSKRGFAYRFSPSRVAQRVLLAKGERVGLLTDGEGLRLLLCDPSRPDSHVLFRLDRAGGWRGAFSPPDSFRLLLALAGPSGVARIADITEQARLTQTRVTAKLREQARSAIAEFVQCLLDHPANAQKIASWTDRQALARELWREGLVIVYRLLFILKLEASSDPARAFSFASTSLWRTTYSPNTALARHARSLLDKKEDTGRMLEDGLRVLFRLFTEGLSSSELKVSPLGGMLFGDGSTALFDDLAWGEEAVARLLDRLLWTPASGKLERQRVHYGPLDVEDLGRVYEALLELEPGIATEPMCRLRRQKLEVVVPVAQGERYKDSTVAPADHENGDGEADDEEEKPKKGAKTRIEWIEEIRPGRFYLRVGLGRKSTGSYYTPHAFVRFLVQETLGPEVEERSPKEDPRPGEILKLKVLDPAMGSGHFLVEACRFLGEKLYEACRLCDEVAIEADKAGDAARAAELRRRVEELPDPNDELVAYLPSRVPEGEASGLSQRKALAIARRLVTVHCLYGVDKNPLAVELAKLSLWLESYAEGLPLTFLDHRLVCGNSLTGPFVEHLFTLPGSGEPIEGVFTQGLRERLTAALGEALSNVRELEKSVGKDVAEVEAKRAAKVRLDKALAPFKQLARAWSGGVMLGEKCDDGAYEALAKGVAERNQEPLAGSSATAVAADAVSYDVSFPEVFYPTGDLRNRSGFDAVLTNPPWDAIQFKSKEFLAAFDIEILDAPTKRETEGIEGRLAAEPVCARLFAEYQESFERQKRLIDSLYEYQKIEIEGDLAGRQLDSFRVFMERNAGLLGPRGLTGVVVPSAFHANEGATGVRRLYLEKMALRCCYSFENRNKLFEIHRSFKFAVVVASAEGPTTKFPCAFYLQDIDWLFADTSARALLEYTLDFVRETGGEYLSLLEPRDRPQAEIILQMYRAGVPLRELLAQWGITPNTSELPMLGNDVFVPVAQVMKGDVDVRTPEAVRALIALGYMPLHEGKTFHQFDDLWEEKPRYVVRMTGLRDRPRWLHLPRYYRLVYREVSASTNERTGIATVLPPGTVNTRTAASDVSADRHPTRSSLLFSAVFNSYSYDFMLRVVVQTHVTRFVIERTPFPTFALAGERLLAHSAIRLCAAHEAFRALWREHLGEAWREPGRKQFNWPVLDGDDARWSVRAAIDAVVANAYGLTREQYQHVLSSFNHKSYPKAPELCLAAIGELKRLGVEAFCKKHDPYWDIPLNEKLPEPVIDLPVPEGEAPTQSGPEPDLFRAAANKPPRARSKRRTK